ncbi:MAG: glycosyltransferase [Actinomycetota bacterium]
MATTHVERPAAPDATRNPSVLVVLVARDAAGWLRGCLQSLANQSHERLGVVAVDNASTDGTGGLLSQALGEQRVIRLAENRGLAGAMRAAMQLPAANAADYLLVLHDDTALAPDAVARMVEAAEGIRGVERVGIVGPKVVDWEDPRLLREVGRSTDRFGHPYTPLQDGELDQGQYDRVLEVLFVSSCAMLVSREAWQRTGAFDERFAGHHDDLDFCWRARLAGFRVLMTPLALARHRGASARGERHEERRRRSSRYYAERAGLASMLKAYGLVTLVWLLPVYTVLGLARLVYLALSRRFEDAFDLVAAWGWNLVHLPGTVRRRVRAQSVRSVRDRSVRRFMASTFRLPRWFERAEEFLDEGFEGIDEEEENVRLRRRAAAIAVGHPVLLASAIGIVLVALAVRHFIGAETISGGALPAFPGAAEEFFRELLSGVRTTVLGGAQPASPALAALGGASWLSFGSTDLAQKAILGALPPIAAILAYRSFARQTEHPGSSVVAAAAFVLSGVGLWVFSEGRIGLLVVLATLPVIWDRLDGAFGRRRPDRPLRFGVALGVAVAVAVSFEPGALLGIGLMALAHLVGARRRVRGGGLTLLGIGVAAILAFPVVADLVSGGGGSLASFVGSDDPWSVLLVVPDGGPGSWALAGFLPVAAIVCFAAVATEQRGRAWRAMAVAVAGTGLAWASTAGYLPDPLTNAPVYLATAAFCEAAVIAYGLPGLISGLQRQAFGARQLAAALLTVVLAVGLGAQALQVTLAEWEVRPNGLPPAWPVIDSSAPGEFRILWIGTIRGDRFPAPGGDPLGLVPAGDASVRFGLTDRHGASALDIGRPSFGPGYDRLRSVLDELLAGSTSHAGSMLGPFGVRYLVSAEGDLPPAARARLDAQADLDRIPAGGLTIYRNAAELPTAFLATDEAWTASADATDLAEIAARPIVAVERIPPPESGEVTPIEGAGEAVAADQFDAGWRIENAGESLVPRQAFGWAISSPVEGGSVSFLYTEQWMRTMEMVALGVAWLAAMWITRKPGSA